MTYKKVVNLAKSS